MSQHIPTHIDIHWSRYFHSLQFQSIFTDVISAHTRTIAAIFEQRPGGPIDRLNDKAFWEGLERTSSFSQKVIELKQEWELHGSLAHLNTKQLLILYKEEVVPLERAYQHLMHELKTFDQNPLGQTSQWLFGVKKHHQEMLNQIAQSQQILAQLKNQIYHSLYYRCHISQQLKLPQNMDDVIFAFCQDINALNLLAENFALSDDPSVTLNDDRRLMIFDILDTERLEGMVPFNESQLHDVVAPIQKRVHPLLSSRRKVDKALSTIRDFSKEIKQDLELAGHGAYLFSGQDVLRNWISHHSPSWSKILFQKVADQFRDWGILSLAQNLWKFRYAFYLIGSLAVYHQLIFLMQPLVIATFGIGMFNAVSTALFYTVGMAPAWYLGWSFIEDLEMEGHHFIMRWKKQQVLEGLDFLEGVGQFVASQLHPAIVDLTHFDIDQIDKKVQDIEAAYAKIEQKLQTYHFWEKTMSTEKIRDKVSLLISRLQIQQVELKTQLNHFAYHIAESVGNDISLLRERSNKYAPLLPEDQINKLQCFVAKYGDEAAKEKFAQNADVVDQWLRQLKGLSEKQKGVQFFLKETWGNQLIRTGSLHGWQTILEAFTLDPEKKSAALTLNSLLLGKIELTREAFVKAIKTLAPEKATEVQGKIATILFQTLAHRNPQHATLLLADDKAKIDNWYKTHRNEIQTVCEFINKIINKARGTDSVPDELEHLDEATIQRYYALLDGGAIYSHAAQRHSSESKAGQFFIPQNLIRQCFTEYQGQYPRVYRLIGLIPQKAQRLQALEVIAKKRLNWIMDHLQGNTDPFTPVDNELFCNKSLVKTDFSFAQVVKQHSKYTSAWSEDFEHFLSICCTKHAFGQGNLHLTYKKKHGLDSPTILHQSLRHKRSRTESRIDTVPQLETGEMPCLIKP